MHAHTPNTSGFRSMMWSSCIIVFKWKRSTVVFYFGLWTITTDNNNTHTPTYRTHMCVCAKELCENKFLTKTKLFAFLAAVLSSCVENFICYILCARVNILTGIFLRVFFCLFLTSLDYTDADAAPRRQRRSFLWEDIARILVESQHSERSTHMTAKRTRIISLCWCY